MATVPDVGRGTRSRNCKEVHKLICKGYTDVVDADLSKYFDTIPHAQLIKSVARRIVDRHMLRLIKLWLQAPVEERDAGGNWHMTGGGSEQVLSPMRTTSSSCRVDAQRRRWNGRVGSLRGVITRLGLCLNEEKTSVRDARAESFDFLGDTFGPHRFRKGGLWYLGASPSRRSVQRIKNKIGVLLDERNSAPTR